MWQSASSVFMLDMFMLRVREVEGSYPLAPIRATVSMACHQRGIMAPSALEAGALIAERPDATPNPAVEVRESLPDGTEFKAVWSHLRQSGVAKLVAVHFFDRG
jgi:hypothetical protein